MANWSDPRTTSSPFGAAGARAEAYDAGLRSYMLSVYNYLASGVLLTGIVALLFVQSGAINALVDVETGQRTLAYWVVALSPLAIVLAMSMGAARLSTVAMQALYWGFAILMGMSLSTLSIAYSPTAIAQAFFATAAGFVGLSLWGYTTKRDLSGFGTFLIMGVVGVFVASLLNVLVFRSGVFDLAISAVGLLIFAGLTAYDTQKVKSIYSYVAGTDMIGKVAIQGALTLYLDFINMFLFVLRLFGSRD